MGSIIINADDFGLKPSVNLAIIELFKNRLINSTTLMVNRSSFEEAIDLAYKNQITAKIGLHLDLEEGTLFKLGNPYINQLSKDSSFDLKKMKNKLFFLSRDSKNLIYKEFAMQIKKVMNTGINVTHIDTHHHLQEIFPVTRIIVALLKDYNIPSMRILNNLNKSTKFHKIVYRKMVNRFLSIQNVNFTDFFGNQIDVVSQLRRNQLFFKDKRLEVMVHPDYNDAGAIINKINSQVYHFVYPEELLKLINDPGIF